MCTECVTNWRVITDSMPIAALIVSEADAGDRTTTERNVTLAFLS